MAPEHKISMSRSLWDNLVADLVRRGDGVRESGAFLLGEVHRGRREVSQYVPYDELEPGCLDDGYINFTAAGYRKLWKVLKECQLEVVADIHTHPRGPGQSSTDRDNPMMPSAGHMGFILPNYAQGQPAPQDAALYVFEGNQQWTAYQPGGSAKKFYVGFWS